MDLLTRINRLSPNKRTVLALRIKEQRSASAARGANAGKRLAAYVVPHPQRTISTRELRRFLMEKLPDYMVPAAFVILDEMPKTPNGKIDRRALPDPGVGRPDLEEEFVAASSSIEKKLADIWAEVLGLEQVGIHDNFFELGGDSILSIQIISKANQAGLHLSPVHIFQYQTVAELAQAVGEESMIHAEQGVVTGMLPLTPIQHWFFEKNLPAPDHWNVSLLLEVRRAVPAEHFRQAAQALLAHHDALRIRYSLNPPLGGAQGGVADAAGIDSAHLLLRGTKQSPAREQEIASSKTPRNDGQAFATAADKTSKITITQTIASIGEDCPFDRVDVSAIKHDAQAAAIEQKTAEFQAKLSLGHGPLMRLVLFERGADQNPYLLLVLHHLVCDVVSWRVLIEDLQKALQQLEKGREIELPAKTTSFKYWVEKLDDYAQSDAVLEELDDWANALPAAQPPLPFDYENDLSANTEESTRTVKVFLSAEETRALIQEVPKVYTTQINDILLTALVQSFGKWTGEASLLVDLEGHGREAIFEEVDLSRTVAWFTSFYPAYLSLTLSGFPNPDRVGSSDPGAALRAIKEQVRNIPNRGFNYGLLRYLNKNEQAKTKLHNLLEPLINFNYLGQFDQVLEASSLFALVQETNIYDRSPKGPRSHVLEIVGSVIRGSLQVEWSYSENLHKAETIERLANDYLDALRAIIDHCKNAGARDFSASDFADFQWDQGDLADITAAIGQSMGSE